MKLINYGKKIGSIIEEKYGYSYSVVESRFTESVYIKFYDIDLNIMLQKNNGKVEIRVKGEGADNWYDVEHHTSVPKPQNKYLDDLIFDIETVIEGREKFKLPEYKGG